MGFNQQHIALWYILIILIHKTSISSLNSTVYIWFEVVSCSYHEFSKLIYESLQEYLAFETISCSCCILLCWADCSGILFVHSDQLYQGCAYMCVRPFLLVGWVSVRHGPMFCQLYLHVCTQLGGTLHETKQQPYNWAAGYSSSRIKLATIKERKMLYGPQ